MSKRHIFLRVFSKIAIFACVFCAFSAWADTTCDTNFTPIMGNSIQNGTPTPTTPVEVVSVGNKTKNLFDSSYILKTTGWTVNENVYTGEIAHLYNKFITAGYPFDRPFKANTSYTIKYHCKVLSGTKVNPRIMVHYTDGTMENVIPIPREVGEEADALLTTPNNKTIKKVTFGYGSTGNVEFDNIILTEGSTPTSYTPYGYRIPGTSIYLDEPLRKVGNYADELRPDGTVIRRVGVKVLDGTENWIQASGTNNSYLSLPDAKGNNPILCSHFSSNSVPRIELTGVLRLYYEGSNTIYDNATVKAYLAEQYAAGTPVTVYYPLATEVVENWSCGPIADIKIATTKFVDEEFKAAEAKLATTVQTIESVVSRTIAQTGQIQILQDTKQTRPDESCPANMKCLLVQDEDGTPHWYPIIEP